MKVSSLTIDQLCRFMSSARPLDLLECYHASKENFSATLISDMTNACCLYDEDTNEVYCIWGIEAGSVIWMLCTSKVEEHPIRFLRFCRNYLQSLEYKKLYNFVWLGNNLHVKWLKWMGAEFGKTIPINDEPFQYFEFKKE